MNAVSIVKSLQRSNENPMNRTICRVKGMEVTDESMTEMQIKFGILGTKLRGFLPPGLTGKS